MILLPLLAALIATPAPAPEALVREFVADYNERDFAGFEAALAEDVKWYSVDGATVSVDGDGRAAIMAWVRNYLERSCTSCRSELLSVAASGDMVATVERAIWTRADGSCVSQSSPAIYSIAEGRIRAVWYFPASAQTPCPAP